MVRSGVNDLGKFLPPQGGWTEEGIKCYQRGCICEGCIHQSGFYQTFTARKRRSCQMKASVLEMVRLLGTPPNVEIKQILEE